MSRLTFIKLDIDAWDGGTAEMTPVQEGVYWRLVRALYNADGTMRDDDLRVSRRLRLNIRTYRKVKSYLIAEGKISVVDEMIIQGRVTEELNAFETRTNRNSNANETQSDSKKPNKNNGKKRQNKNLEEEKEYTSQQDLDSVSEPPDPDLRAGLNGATDLVIADLARWINPTFPDIVTAQGALRTQIGIHGAPIVKQAYGELKAQIDSGDLISRPIVLLDKICQRIKRDGPTVPYTRKTQHDKVQAALKAHAEKHAHV